MPTFQPSVHSYRNPGGQPSQGAVIASNAIEALAPVAIQALRKDDPVVYAPPPEPETDWTPWVVGGVALVLVIGGGVWYARSK